VTGKLASSKTAWLAHGAFYSLVSTYHFLYLFLTGLKDLGSAAIGLRWRELGRIWSKCTA